MLKFGLISEGITDNIVLENILIGYFNEDISGYINHLQPPPTASGGWSRVLKYCGSQDFKNDFTDNDFMVIQVDTDKSFELRFDVAHEENGVKLSVEQLIEKVKERFEKLFNDAFGDNFVAEFSNRILFAIAVHETECWLLPLYYLKNTEKTETKNCYEKLNKKIKGLQKTAKMYDAISADLRFPKRLKQASSDNPSFKIFVQNELQTKIPLINTEEPISK
jgi:ribosomal protein S17E